MDTNVLLHGDCLEVLKSLPDNSVDSIVTDPPAGIEFLGKDWDSFKQGRLANYAGPPGGNVKPLGEVRGWQATLPKISQSANRKCLSCGQYKFSRTPCVCKVPDWEPDSSVRDTFVAFMTAVFTEALRVLKPGGHAVIWAIPRTSHWTAWAVENSGFEIRDAVYHAFACLSEDTEILVDGQWEPYHKAIAGRLALCYDTVHATFSWQPIEARFEYLVSDTAFSLRGDRTDQVVSRGHRCLVEQDGAYVFATVEELARQCEARVPVLEDVPGLLAALPLSDQGASPSKHHVLSGACSAKAHPYEDGRFVGGACGVRHPGLCSLRQAPTSAQEGAQGCGSASVPQDVQRGFAQPDVAGARVSGWSEGVVGGGACFLSGEDVRGTQSCLEGRGDVLQQARELRLGEVRQVSRGLQEHGSEGRLRGGAPPQGGASAGTAPYAQGDSASRGSRSDQQCRGEPPALCVEPGSQAVRASRFTRSDLVRVEEVPYNGIVWCVRVPTGAFVVRRNGKVFVTGNTGFPKNHDVSKAIAETDPALAKRWEGWGTALKPAVEVWWLARKPLAQTVAKSVVEFGTGALNIDGCRVGEHQNTTPGGMSRYNAANAAQGYRPSDYFSEDPMPSAHAPGRWPTNFVMTHAPDCEVGHCVEGCPLATLNKQAGRNVAEEQLPSFYFVPKPGRSEKEQGLDDLPVKIIGTLGGGGEDANDPVSKRFTKFARNTHPCLHPDALVMTPIGFRPIKDLQIGSLVLSADGNFHSVEACTSHPYTSESLVEIRVLGTNLTTLASDNHPFLIWRPVRKGKHIEGGSVLWVCADAIEVGDYTMTPEVHAGPVEQPPRPEDTEFWFLVGLYLAEGYNQSAGHGDGTYPVFSLHENETDLIDRVRAYVAPVNVGVYGRPDRPDSHGVSAVVFDPEMGRILMDLCGKGAATKQLHPCVWNLPDESLDALIDGYIAGDGGLVRTYLQAKTSSRDLASQMRFLGEMRGYKVELQLCDPEPGQIGGREFKEVLPYYALRMSNRNRDVHGRKPSKPTVLEHDGTRYLLSYVKSCERVPYAGDVLNLTVEGSPTFQTAVGMSHNTPKPTTLMQHLVRLVTPPGGIVLDPFAGSGTTCLAAIEESMQFIGIEREDEYINIARARIRAVREAKEASEHQRDLFALAMEES